MSVRAVVFVPAAPIILEQVAGDAAADVAAVRSAAVAALTDQLSERPGAIVYVAQRTGRHRAAVPARVPALLPLAPLDLSGLGVAGRVLPAGADAGSAAMQTPAAVELAVGVDLVNAAGQAAGVDLEAVPQWALDLSGVSHDEAAACVAAVPDGALIVSIGDGSATRDVKAPGYVVEGAVEFDDALAAAFASGDARWIGGAAALEAERFLVGGMPVWRAVCGALGAPRAASLQHASAPLGVLYVVATWAYAGSHGT